MLLTLFYRWTRHLGQLTPYRLRASTLRIGLHACAAAKVGAPHYTEHALRSATAMVGAAARIGAGHRRAALISVEVSHVR